MEKSCSFVRGLRTVSAWDYVVIGIVGEGWTYLLLEISEVNLLV